MLKHPVEQEELQAFLDKELEPERQIEVDRHVNTAELGSWTRTGQFEAPCDPRGQAADSLELVTPGHRPWRQCGGSHSDSGDQHS